MTQAMVDEAGLANATDSVSLPRRIWLYTNFDCNLACTYCLSSSSPRSPRRELPIADYRRLIDEAAECDLAEALLTGGEPFLLPDIAERIEYAAARMPVTVLTNGLLLRGPRWQRLLSLRDLPLTLQVSLDGHRPELHDPYRGKGTWARTVEAVRCLLENGFRVTIGATLTPLNAPYEDELRRFVLDLGITEDQFFARPLTKRGFSEEGVRLGPEDLLPELTVSAEGVFWHPQTGGEIYFLSRSLFPLRSSLELLRTTYQRLLAGGPRPQVYRCA